MEHREYVQLRNGSTTAILFIHGIVGTPNHFRELVSLIPDTFSIYNLLLDGHGKGVRDFSKTSMKKWESQVSAVVERLSETHDRIYIVAHSLGTLLAIEQAVKREKISRLFLLAVPLRLSLKPKMFINSLKVFFNKISPDDFEALAAKNCYGIEADKNPFHYVGWIPRFFELFAKIRQTRAALNTLRTPSAVYQSKNDELVSNKSITYLKQNPYITVNELNSSGHYYYGQTDWAFLLSEFNKMLNVK